MVRGILPTRLPPPLKFLLPALVLAAFLTETRFIPSIANNVGFFEGLGLILILLFFTTYQAPQIRWNTVVKIVGLLLAVATASLINLPVYDLGTGLVQTSILVFLFLFLLVLYNFCLRYQISPGAILRMITLSALVVGPWILSQAVQDESAIEAVGPFRNRAHMASYMLTAFWLVAISFFWPGKYRFKRPVCYSAMALCLYAVAVSGRRSVYLSLFIGLAALVVAFLAARQGKRSNLLVAGLFAAGFLLGLYTLGSEFLPRGDFFRTRVGMIGSRLEAATSTDSDDGVETFFAMQRRGVQLAARDHPLLGIGWGGFASSDYSPTGHEVHSTPLRFLAETGALGLATYLLLIGYLLGRSAQLALQMRQTPYGLSYLIMTIALWSLAVSWLYNRHVTERTFWLMLIVFTLFEPFARTIQHRLAGGRERKDRRRRQRPRQLPALGRASLPASRPGSPRR